MISSKEILENLDSAIAGEEFQVYFQPQYNHSTGMLIGAEALVRWASPKFGFVSPADFIPVLEEQGRIPEIDLYVFERVCRFLRHSIDSNLPLVRISVNMSRNDILREDYIQRMDALRCKYDVPTKLIHVELTETAAISGSQIIIDTIDKLHRLGYTVEMDDFGSGYSSLNVLKDIDFDVLKLDLKFIAGSIGNERGGTILSSIVRMAKWLQLPVIAEGVETVEQADFLKSVGCDYVQGFLYSKPVPISEYEKLLNGNSVGSIVPQMNLNSVLDAGKFWDPDSLETLIFSNFVGAAAILEQRGDSLEVLRVNPKFLREMGMNLSEKDLVNSNPVKTMDASNMKIYMECLEKAAEKREEQECETWRNVRSACCGFERLCVRSCIQLIGVSKVSRLFFVTIRNITVEKNMLLQMQAAERRFKAASEQANIYFWEYSVATKEMRPCFRCQRDLGLPPLVRNYPEPVIENGFFPADFADMYREWHRKIDAGLASVEGIIPLTEKRIPFHVRYTTEFDENGRPVKAYGSATMVVD
ncbi:EAL domain, c-di-GMP-specific phosphodiesterase class I (or its enzymatically inactive variant) [Fibrobacter sp. UWH9]|uniref:EAL domain-containing protein n=1 Tax=Fibrobacter sp. UWH9 TaxID=1896213 RepID=UPI00091A5FC3|nr:EAL domain-containing protein [Fibrobacter sp. UWH9]SHG52651.1 EAL domain, c-di-GMP-specific phosphodiesterase class I (or its enzymatically inactive variant) [Fibrobacter sp. UWH9]